MSSYSSPSCQTHYYKRSHTASFSIPFCFLYPIIITPFFPLHTLLLSLSNNKNFPRVALTGLVWSGRTHKNISMEKVSFVKNGELRLPPGFRFHPTDEELVLQYLKRKVFSCPLPASIIPELHVCKSDPWDLPGSFLFSIHTHHPLSLSLISIPCPHF